MIFVGDYFALALVIVLCCFYFDGKKNAWLMTKANKYFVACLLLTAATAATDLLSGQLLADYAVPLWANILVNSMYFAVNIVTTSCIALFLFTKILEHAEDNHCMVYACRGLVILGSVFTVVLLTNLWTGWLFWFDADGVYQRGPLNGFGYVITICQMGLVLVCYARNRKNAGRSMRRFLMMVFPVGILGIMIQRIFPEIMLNGILMAMVDAVLFLIFQGQQPGVHGLTKLDDRYRFFRDVESRLEHGREFQVFLINLKNFGIVNQKYGHLQGDEILYRFAFALKKLIRGSVAFHMSGTVFALVLPYRTPEAANAALRTVERFLEEGIPHADEQLRLDYILAEYIAKKERDADAAEVYEKLEYAVAEAYRQKRRCLRYTDELGEQMRRSRYLIDRLKTVDRVNGFHVWYQPIRCLETGRFCSMEALVRLREADGTLVSPAEFIPLAEQTGAVRSVTWFVLEEACDFLAAHPELGDVSISVNLPMAQLLEENFHARLNRIVDARGLRHRQICLEFTERAILDNFLQTKQIMERLTEDGYRFYLDDFGAGYSNFNCLLQLPFQFIKLDAGLLRSENSGLVGTLTKLFHDMDLRVIAEGAETPEEAEMLSRQGVDRVQGFVFARPMPDKLLLDFYRDSTRL